MRFLRVHALRSLLTLVLVPALFAAASEATAPPPARTATILAINDTYRIEGLQDGRSGGLARVRDLRVELERTAGEVLVLHAGDLLFPSLISRLRCGEQMIDVLNVLDGNPTADDPRFFAVFGNHEFDEPKACPQPDTLRKQVARSQFTWLGTNVAFQPDFDAAASIPPKRIVPRALITIAGVRVGLFGLTTDMAQPKYVASFGGVLATAEAESRRLRLDGAEVVVAVTHLNAAEDVGILRTLGRSGPDLIVGGHDHEGMAWVEGVPVFKADADARTASVIRLTVRGGDLRIDHTFHRLDASSRQPDADVQAVVDGHVRRHEADFCAGASAGAACLGTTLGHAWEPLEGDEKRMRGAESSLGNWITDRMRDRFATCGAQVAFINAGTLRMNQTLERGATIQRRHLEELIEYDGPLRLLEVDGKTLQEVVEHAVDQWPGSGRWLQVSGLAFVHDSKAGTVRRLTLLGETPHLVQPDERIRIVTTEFLADKGGDGYAMLANKAVPCTETTTLRDVVEKGLASGPPTSPSARGRICQGDGDCLAAEAKGGTSSRPWWPQLLAAVLASGTVLLPSLFYLLWGWRERKDEILSLFDADAIESYFFQFYPGNPLAVVADVDNLDRARELRAKMDRHYRQHSGPFRFLAGWLLLAIVVTCLNLWVAWAVGAYLWTGTLPTAAPPWLAVTAIGGAYLWVATDHLQKWAARSLGERDPLQAAVRLIVSVPFAYAVSSLFDDALAFAIAFGLGALPLDGVMLVSRQLLVEKTGLKLPDDKRLPLSEIPSIGEHMARRLAAEEVRTVSELAYANPVVLAIRSQIEFVPLSDHINVALLWKYIGDKVLAAAPLGIGGAQEVADLHRRLQQGETKAGEILKKLMLVLDSAAPDQASTENVVMQVAEDPYTRFLCELWKRPSAALVRALLAADIVVRGGVIAPAQYPGEQAFDFHVDEVLYASGPSRPSPGDTIRVRHTPDAGAPVDTTPGVALFAIGKLENGELRTSGARQGLIPDTAADERRLKLCLSDLRRHRGEHE